jgi:hypothetical protein
MKCKNILAVNEMNKYKYKKYVFVQIYTRLRNIVTVKDNLFKKLINLSSKVKNRRF